MTKKTDLERRVFCAFVAGMFSVVPALPVMAQGTAPASAPAAASDSGTHTPTTPNLANLNLSSRSKTVAAPYAGTIREGARTATYNVGDLVTPAQALALSQLVTTGTQSLILNTLGTAVGGTFRIAGSSVDTLVIPRGVTGLGNFSSGSALNLTGNLTNSGKLYVFSTDAAANTAAINALNIYNNAGGLLSSALPASLLASLGGIGSLNLSLSAINNIVNAGIIRSSGSLSLTAGNSIINALPSGVTGAMPTIQAANNVNLAASNIVNSGLISSLTSNINLAGINNGSFSVNNAGGTMKALLGNINVRDSLFAAKSDFNLIGGDLLSKQLNIFGGNGIANVHANQISGLVNVTAGEAHLTVDKGNLAIGTFDISGDPTIYNKTGDVLLTQNISVLGASLAVVARRNIISTSGISISTRPTATGDSGEIILVAGAEFAIPSTSTQSGQAQLLPGIQLSIFSGSATGGKIDLKTTPILSLDSSGNGGDGGDITMVAYKGSAAGSGTISLPSNVVITASGAAGKANGDVTVIAGATAGTGISLGGIDTASGGGTGGAITLTTATPTITVNLNAPVPSITVDIVDGAFDENSALFTPGTTTAAGISLGTVATTSGSTFTALTKGAFLTGAGGNITAGGTTANPNGSAISINAASVNLHNITSNGNPAAGNGGTITVSTTGALALNGAISANGFGATGEGGTVNITGGALSGTSNIAINANASGTGDGGNVVFWSTGAYGVGSGNGQLNVSATGGSLMSASGDGGSITLDSGSNLTVDPAALKFGPLGDNGKGGSVTLAAGFKKTAGNLLINGPLIADGKGTGDGGSIQLYSISTTPFDIETAATKNGITGIITANGGTTAGANGGGIYIQNSGTGGITLDPSKLQAAGSINGGDGGSITIAAATDAPNLTASGIDVDFNRTIPAIIGKGFITSNLAAKGAVTILGGTLDASGSAAGGNGGTIGIVGTTVTNTGALAVNAKGSGSGDGGEIYIGTGAVNAGITVGGATNPLTLDASSGTLGGNGGTVALKATQGSINVTTSGLAFGPAAGGNGDGGTLQLAAGDSKSTANRNVFVSGPALDDLNGVGAGAGGKLFVVSNSSNAFTFGGATAGGNGFENMVSAYRGGSANAANGTILFSNYHRNLAGAAFNDSILTDVYLRTQLGSPAGGGGPTIALLDLASDNVEAKSAVTINVPAVSLNLSATGSGVGSGGNLILEANSFKGFTESGQLTVKVNAIDTGNGGTVILRQTSTTSALTTDAGATAGKVDVEAQGGTTAGNGGKFYLGAATVDASGLNAFKVQPLGTNGDGGSVAFIAQKMLTLSGSTYDLSGIGTGRGGSIDVAGSNPITLTYDLGNTDGGSVQAISTAGNVALTSLGTGTQTVFASSAKGTFSLTSAGGLFLAGSITSGQGMTIDAATGDILTGSIDTNTAVLKAPSINISADTGSIGYFDQTDIDDVIDQRVLTATPHLTVFAGGTTPTLSPNSPPNPNEVFIAPGAYISNKGALTLDNAAADNAVGALMISSSGNLTVPSGPTPISASNIYLRTSGFSNGNVVLNRQIGTSTAEGSIIQISADGKGSITQGTDNSYNLKADFVYLDFESFVPDDPTQPAPNGNIGTAANPIRVEGVLHPSVNKMDPNWLNNPIEPTAKTVNLGSLTFGKGIYIAANGDADLSNFFDVEGVLNLSATGNLIVSSQLATLGGGKSNSITLTAGNDFYLAKFGAVGFSDSLNVRPGNPPVAFIEPGSTVKINAGGSIFATIYSTNPADLALRGVIRGHDVTLNAGAGDIGAAEGDPLLVGIFPKVSVAASNLYLNAKNGSAWVGGEDISTLSFLPINIKQASLKPTNSTLEMFSFRPIVVGTAINVDRVDLEVYQGLIGDITLNANVGNAGPNDGQHYTKLSADLSSNIIQNAGKIFSPLVILGGMTVGDIGSAARPIRTAAEEIRVGTQYPLTGAQSGPHTGNTYIANTSTALTLYGGGVKANPPMTIPGEISGGVISISNTGSITVPAGNPLQAATLSEARAGDGVTVGFGYTFAATSASQIQVYDYDNNTQTATPIATNAYSVNLQTKTVNLNTALANNHTLLIARTTSPSITLTTTNGDITLGDKVVANHNIIDAPRNDTSTTTTFLDANTVGITSNVKLTAGGAGNIVTTGGVIQGDNVTLVTNTGSLGTMGSPLDISSPQGATANTNISATTKGATSNIFINATSKSTVTSAIADTVTLLAKNGDMTLNGTIGKAGTTANPTSVNISNFANENILGGTKVNVLGSDITLNVQGTGDIGSGDNGTTISRVKLSPKNSLSVTAEKAYLQTTAATNLAGGVNVTDTLDLISAGAITGSANAPNVTLKTTAGSIGTSTSRFVLNGAGVTNYNLTAATDVFINDTSGTSSTIKGSSKGTFDVLAHKNTTVDGVVASKLVNVVNDGGTITLNNNVKAPTVSLSTSNFAISGNIAATSLTVNAGTGNVNLTNAGRLTVNSAAGNDVSLTTTGAAASLTAKGAITGQNITLQTNATGASGISIASQVGGTGSNVTLRVQQGTGTITRTATGMLTGDDFTLETAGGLIGSSSMPINTTGTGATNNLQVGMSAGTGNVYLNNNSGANDTVFSQSATKLLPGAVTLTDTSANLTLNGAINIGTVNTKSTSNFIVTEKTGNIIVANNGNASGGDLHNGIYVTGGSATLQAIDGAKTITFNTDASLKTDVAANTSAANGVVKVVVVPKLPTTGTSFSNPPPGVTVDNEGANVIVGAGSASNPVSALSTGTLHAKGRPVFISAVNAGSIILNNALIEADPPVSPASVTAATHGNASTQTPSVHLPELSTSTASAQEQQQVAINAPAIPMNVISTATARDTMQPRVLTGGVALNKSSASSNSTRGNRETTSQQLQAGGTVLAPDHDITIATPFGPLNVGAHAIVLTVLNADGLAIYDLHDDHLGDVSLAHANGALELHPGQHAFLTRSSKDYETLNPLTFVAHRNLKSNDHGHDTVFTSEFSITSALSKHGPLAGLLRSSNADERRIMSRLMKDAAILMHTKAAQGQYKRITPSGLSYAH